MRVSVLTLNDVFDTGLATILDAFWTANELAAMTGIASLRFDVSIIGLRRSVHTSQGLSVPVVSPARLAPEMVVVPALGFKMPEPLEAALARPEVDEAA